MSLFNALSKPILFVLFLAACTSAAEQQAAQTLCEFRERPLPTLMMYFDKTSLVYIGEIDVEKFAEELDSVASAVARPTKKVYRREDKADCRNEATGAWYPCKKVVEVDLSRIEVIVRGYDLDRVSRHAVQVCNRRTLNLIPRSGNARVFSGKYRCELVRRQFCPLQ